MPAKEIKELRQAGKLEEALLMAKAELQEDPENIWAKRNISWVYYEYLKHLASADHLDNFIVGLGKIKNLNLPAEETMLFDNVSWQVGKMVFALSKLQHADVQKIIEIFELTQAFHFTKPSEGYSFLFKAFHRALKETDRYLVFADWWNFENFRPEDFQKDKLPDGKEIMSIVEQAYITYAKHLLPKQTQFELLFDKQKVESFLPLLNKIIEQHPQYQYPAYYKAKLLLALGDNDNMLSALLPFARKRRNDFWVWDILSETFRADEEKVLACFCRALTCPSPEEMLVNLRQRLALILIKKQLYSEAKTEIELLVKARTEHDFRIPGDVTTWQKQDWYKGATSKKSNIDFYKKHTEEAEALLFTDVPEDSVFISFVNHNAKVLNFIATDGRMGFFRYDRFIQDAKIGTTLKVRFKSGEKDGIHQVFSVSPNNDEKLKQAYLKDFEGELRIADGKAFGFVNDIFVHPSIISKNKLITGAAIRGTALKSYNTEKKQWGWKMI